MGYNIGVALLVLECAVFSTQFDVTTNSFANHPNLQLLPEDDCGRDLSNRIIGGIVTELDEHTWIVLLIYRFPGGFVQGCGGSIANKRYVVTAAHCVKGKDIPSNYNLYYVRIGEYNIQTDPDCVSDDMDSTECADKVKNIKIEQEIAHEKYDPLDKSQKYDIALLRLMEEIEFTEFVKPICLPMTPDIGQKFEVAGWGVTEKNSNSVVKLKVSIPLVDKKTCADKYATDGITLVDSQICAGGAKGLDTCKGDSGGALMQRVRDKMGLPKWTQVGVVSFGRSPCGAKGWPGVYTKLYDFMPWLLNKIRA